VDPHGSKVKKLTELMLGQRITQWHRDDHIQVCPANVACQHLMERYALACTWLSQLLSTLLFHGHMRTIVPPLPYSHHRTVSAFPCCFLFLRQNCGGILLNLRHPSSASLLPSAVVLAVHSVEYLQSMKRYIYTVVYAV